MLHPTVQRFPLDPATKVSANFPWGVCITPLAGSSPVDTSDRSQLDTPRCSSCGAYICALSPSRGNSWRCILCYHVNYEEQRARAEHESAASSEGAWLASQDDGHYSAHSSASPLYELRGLPDGSASESVLFPCYAFVFTASELENSQLAADVVAAGLEDAHPQSRYALLAFSSSQIAWIDAQAEQVRTAPLDSWVSRLTSVSAAHGSDSGVLLRTVGDEEILNDVRMLREIGLSQTRNSGLQSLAQTARCAALAIDHTVALLQRSNSTTARIGLFLTADSAAVSSSAQSDASVNPTSEQARIETPAQNARARLLDFCEAILGTRRLTDNQVVRYAHTVGSHAAQAGALVDVFITSQTRQASQALARLLSPLAHGSGGFLQQVHQGDEETTTRTLTDVIRDRFQTTIALNGILRIRTSRDFYVSHIHGNGIQRDNEVHDIFHVPVGNGELTTIFAEFNHSDIEGFTGAPHSPALQLVYSCTIVTKRFPLRHVIRIQSMIPDISSSRSRIRESANFTAISIAMYWLSSDLPSIFGTQTFNDFPSVWLTCALARTPAAETLTSAGRIENPTERQSAALALAKSIASPRSQLGPLPAVAFDLAHGPSRDDASANAFAKTARLLLDGDAFDARTPPVSLVSENATAPRLRRSRTPSPDEFEFYRECAHSALELLS